MAKTFRIAFRLARTLVLFLTAFLDFVFRLALTGRAGSFPARAAWLQYWARNLARILCLEVRFEGRPPQRGILVSNHLSYLDVLVLGSMQPAVFVAKSEVASWPVIGRLTRCAGTLYIVRQQKSDVVRLGEEIAQVTRAGVLVTLFPEGTSSDGREVLPFRSSLLAPAEAQDWPVTGAWIRYALREGDGSVERDVCYWGDMTFGSHFLKLLARERIEALVRFGPPLRGNLDRKEMARELHAQVCRLKDGPAADPELSPSAVR